MSAEYSVHFEVAAQVQEKKIEEQLIALGWTPPKHTQATSNNEGKNMSAKDIQVGGSHYADKAIQPIDYIMQNNLNFCEGSIVKYITRWREKGGVEDLRKVKHYCDFLIEAELEK
jgi:hypothetical protein